MNNDKLLMAECDKRMKLHEASIDELSSHRQMIVHIAIDTHAQSDDAADPEARNQIAELERTVASFVNQERDLRERQTVLAKTKEQIADMKGSGASAATADSLRDWQRHFDLLAAKENAKPSNQAARAADIATTRREFRRVVYGDHHRSQPLAGDEPQSKSASESDAANSPTAAVQAAGAAATAAVPAGQRAESPPSNTSAIASASLKAD